MSKAITPGMLDLHDYVKTVRILHPTRGAIPFQPYDYQTVSIQHIEDNPLSVLSIARQLGSTTSIMAWALWTAGAKPGSKIIVMANSLSPAIEALDRVRVMIEQGTAALPYVRENNRGAIGFNNGSSIKVRAVKPLELDDDYTHLIIMDANWVAPTRMEDAWASFLPHISRGMRVVLQGQGGDTGTVYHRAVEGSGKNGFAHLYQDWTVHPDRGDEWAEYHRQHISEETFRKEYENAFITRV